MNSATCRKCGNKIDRSSNIRLRYYCSVKCRTSWHNHEQTILGNSRARQQRSADALSKKPSSFKKKCAVCGLWYRRVGHHVRQRHAVTAKEYRANMNLPLSHGILTDDAREHLRALALDNKMDEQLKKAGVKTRYRKNDPRAKKSYPLAGKRTPKNDYF